jgi:hypothetical protein
MYTTPLPGTEEGGQLYSAVDFIAHEHHEGGCIPFCNEEVKMLVGGESISLALFHWLWQTEFLLIQIPPFSRFSKCYHCWEYKYGMEAIMNAAARLQIKKLFLVHI